MYYEVTCSICGLHDKIDDVDDVFDLQTDHQERRGDHHVLEFERREPAECGEPIER